MTRPAGPANGPRAGSRAKPATEPAIAPARVQVMSGPSVWSIQAPPWLNSLLPRNAPPAVIAVPTRIGAIGPIDATPAALMTADAMAAPPSDPTAIPAAPPTVRPRPWPSPLNVFENH